MDYLLTFLEGLIVFISPCLLPMLPIYISYFMGQEAGAGTKKTVKNALGFLSRGTLRAGKSFVAEEQQKHRAQNAPCSRF